MASEFVARTYKTNHSSPIRFVLSHISRHPIFAVLLVAGAFGNAALNAVVPSLIGDAFNAVIDTGDLSVVGTAVMLIVLSQTARAFVQFARNASAEVYGQRIERDVRDELYASLLGKSMSFHDMLPVGEIMARVTNDVREMNLMMTPGVNILVGSSMFLIMPVIAAPLIYPQLILVPLIFVLLQVVIQYRFIRSLHPIAQEVRASFGRMNARLAESLDGLQVVKGAAQEEQETTYFSSLVDTVRDRFIAQGELEARYLANLTFPLAVVGALVHGVLLYQQGILNTGQVVSFVSLMYLFTFPVFSTLFSLPRIALGYASASRILNIINTETALNQNESGYDAPIKGEITFDNVSFGYTPEKEILKNITFTVKPGQTVAVVGQTGSGKTTVTKLINRTYDVTSGRVLVDGVDVRDWNMAALRSQISIIEQDIFLFSRSIADNIRFGNQEATPEEIEDAARKAQAHEFILSFNEGYDTVIGQRGATLSGGQRQRLAIARAFETNPPILILDDSTSAIDSATEDLIQQAIWSASQGRTTILITHRLSQIRWADHIVVLRQGQIVAQGAHEDLLRTSDAYRRIFARYESTEQARNHEVTEG
ncbi:MAG: ABC transporter ATP-binding protein/permease [Anaerolineae bacterium]|nr:ABC transporter ATP-binding protein/permease [Anaerolineae bacterium]